MYTIISNYHFSFSDDLRAIIIYIIKKVVILDQFHEDFDRRIANFLVNCNGTAYICHIITYSLQRYIVCREQPILPLATSTPPTFVNLKSFKLDELLLINNRIRNYSVQK